MGCPGGDRNGERPALPPLSLGSGPHPMGTEGPTCESRIRSPHQTRRYSDNIQKAIKKGRESERERKTKNIYMRKSMTCHKRHISLPSNLKRYQACNHNDLSRPKPWPAIGGLHGPAGKSLFNGSHEPLLVTTWKPGIGNCLSIDNLLREGRAMVWCQRGLSASKVSPCIMA